MRDFFRRYFALATKEVQQLRRNRQLLVQLLIPPTIVLVIFGYALNPKVRGLRLGVVDESLTTESQDFVDALTENVNFKVTHRYARVEDAEDALNRLDLDLFLVIPTDFARSLARRQTASVQVVIDAVDANTAQIAQGYLRRALDEYNANASRVVMPVAELRRALMLEQATQPTPPPGAPDVRARLPV